MTPETELQYQQNPLLSAIVTTALEPNNQELLRRLVKVLGIDAQSNVLLIADPHSQAQDVLAELAAQVETFNGDVHHLPYPTAHFNAAIVTIPVTRGLHGLARELARVLKANGCLGMVVLSVYRDQMPEDAALADQTRPLLGAGRSTAAYRAVLAESGFTAFVTEDRKRDVRRTALASYRKHLLHGTTAEAPVQREDVGAQALGLMASGSVGVALITAEKGL